MLSRITFLLITLFWVTMSYLLWRSEYVGRNQVGSAVPVELVWRKILTAPDNSSLQIVHGGKKVGYCRWASNVGEELMAGKMLTDGGSPDGMATRVSNYRLNFEGTVAVNDIPGRLRFDFEIKLTTNDVWQEFHLRLNLRPTIWEIHSLASEQTVRLLTEDKQGRSEQVFKFADLQNPQKLMQEFDLPAPLGLLGLLNPFPNSPTESKPALSLGLTWKARHDWIAIGHTSVRAYRLEATVLERYRMLVIVSQVGEILRVELPDGWELLNDQLISL